MENTSFLLAATKVQHMTDQRKADGKGERTRMSAIL